MNFSGINSNSISGKILRWPLRLVPRTAQVRIVQGPLRGKKWIAGSSNHGCWLGSYEHAKQMAFCREVRKGSVVYDLGANVGFYSLLASTLVGNEGMVFSFEPSPRNLQYLSKHIELNRILNCRIFDMAVFSNDGVAQFHLDSNHAEGRLIQGKQLHTVPVTTVKLDTLVFSRGMAPPDLLKCDIEGGEYEALKGAEAILRQFAPVIFLATHGPEVHRYCCELLGALGYELLPLDNSSLSEATELIARRPVSSTGNPGLCGLGCSD
jgi:FkbM family methyltransferase